MVKEHFVETYGEPRFTIGRGCSGGTYQGHQIADNYPGLLDGVVSGCSFPDVTPETNQTLSDARVLHPTSPRWRPERSTRSSSGRWPASGGREHPHLSDGADGSTPTRSSPSPGPRRPRYDAAVQPRRGARYSLRPHRQRVRP